MPLGLTRGNDTADARTIAQFTAVMVEDVPPLRRRELDALAELLAYRRQLKDWSTDCTNQLEHLRDAVWRKKIEQKKAGLERELKQIDQKLADLVAKHDDWNALARRLRTVPGVGPVVAATLIVLLPELGSLSRRAIASPRPPPPAFAGTSFAGTSFAGTSFAQGQASQGQAPATAAGGAQRH